MMNLMPLDPSSKNSILGNLTRTREAEMRQTTFQVRDREALIWEDGEVNV